MYFLYSLFSVLTIQMRTIHERALKGYSLFWPMPKEHRPKKYRPKERRPKERRPKERRPIVHISKERAPKYFGLKGDMPENVRLQRNRDAYSIT